MKISKLPVLCVLVLGLGFGAVLCPVRPAAAQSNIPVPATVQEGLRVWAKQGASYAFDVWKKGGLMESDNKPAILANYFRRLDRTLGNYRSWESVDSKLITPSSQIVYLSLNFDRAAVYGRFQLYKTDRDWVVQNMDFSLKPELLMPWLTFEGNNYNQ